MPARHPYRVSGLVQGVVCRGRSHPVRRRGNVNRTTESYAEFFIERNQTDVAPTAFTDRRRLPGHTTSRAMQLRSYRSVYLPHGCEH